MKTGTKLTSLQEFTGVGGIAPVTVGSSSGISSIAATSGGMSATAMSKRRKLRMRRKGVGGVLYLTAEALVACLLGEDPTRSSERV